MSRAAVARQSQFRNFLRSPRTLLVTSLVAVTLIGGPWLHRQIRYFRAVHYIERINPQLKVHPQFHDVYAWKTLKGPILLSFSGSVQTEAELESLKNYIAQTRPPKPYTVGVFVLPSRSESDP